MPIQVKQSNGIGVNVVKNFPYQQNNTIKSFLKKCIGEKTNRVLSLFLLARGLLKKRRGLKTLKIPS
jgi:hypothetical protein